MWPLGELCAESGILFPDPWNLLGQCLRREAVERKSESTPSLFVGWRFLFGRLPAAEHCPLAPQMGGRLDGEETGH